MLKKAYFYDYNLTARPGIMKATHPHIRSAPSWAIRIFFLQYSIYMNCFLLHNILPDTQVNHPSMRESHFQN